MSLKAASLLILCILLEVFREISFKLGSREGAEPKNFLIYFRNLFVKPFILLGITLWLLEVACWIMVLEITPLSYAFPLLSLCYCGTLIASKIILKEEVKIYKWIGAILITIGVALVGSSG
jgi:undecaprenyl phosphate-alpha-L-ara4N flippase subunit ArnE